MSTDKTSQEATLEHKKTTLYSSYDFIHLLLFVEFYICQRPVLYFILYSDPKSILGAYIFIYSMGIQKFIDGNATGGV